MLPEKFVEMCRLPEAQRIGDLRTVQDCVFQKDLRFLEIRSAMISVVVFWVVSLSAQLR